MSTGRADGSGVRGLIAEYAYRTDASMDLEGDGSLQVSRVVVRRDTIIHS